MKSHQHKEYEAEEKWGRSYAISQNMVESGKKRRTFPFMTADMKSQPMQFKMKIKKVRCIY